MRNSGEGTDQGEQHGGMSGIVKGKESKQSNKNKKVK